MSDFYSLYDSANQYEVAFHACPTNLRIIQAKNRKAKSRGGISMYIVVHFGDGKTISGDANNGLGDEKSSIWGAVFLSSGDGKPATKSRAFEPSHSVRER